MPFGLTNAPAAFQRCVNTIFADMLDVCVVMYLDDILIYSKDMESHQQHVRDVLRHLQLHGLFAKPEKCEFHSDSVEYLGYCLSPEGLTMSPDKIQTISNWPEPQKVKDIQSFLGFANFYHQFIFNYSDIVVPHPAHPERCSLELLRGLSTFLQRSQACLHHCTHPYPLHSGYPYHRGN